MTVGNLGLEAVHQHAQSPAFFWFAAARWPGCPLVVHDRIVFGRERVATGNRMKPAHDYDVAAKCFTWLMLELCRKCMMP
jgi:hypothetical protein